MQENENKYTVNRKKYNAVVKASLLRYFSNFLTSRTI